MCVVGYQRELTYKHDDGSYSAFGKNDDSGNTWSVNKSQRHDEKMLLTVQTLVTPLLESFHKVYSLPGEKLGSIKLSGTLDSERFFSG